MVPGIEDGASGIPSGSKLDPGRMLSAGLGDRVRELRVQRDWSLQHLSDLCGVSRSMLSEIERSEANPTVGVALAIARELGVTLDELVTVEDRGSTIELIRADDPHCVYRSDPDCRVRTLSPLAPERELEFYEITLQRGGELRSAPHFTGTREHLTVHRGRIRVESGEQAAELGRGDSAAYPADVNHAIVNLARATAVVYLIDTVPG